MEYDRALFRIYERAMEDLIATASIFSDEQSGDANVNGNANANAIGDGVDDGDGDGDGEAMNRNNIVMMAAQRRHRNIRTNDGMIPFLWPLFLQRYITAANNVYANGGLRGLGYGYRNGNGWRQNFNLSSGNGNGRRWGIFRRRRTRNFMRLSGQDDEGSRSGDDEEMGMDMDMDMGGTNDVEMATLSLSSTLNRNTDGLRRRNPSYDSTGSNASSRTTASSSSLTTSGGNHRTRTVMSNNMIMDNNENEHEGGSMDRPQSDTTNSSSQEGMQSSRTRTRSRIDEENVTTSATTTTANNTTAPTPTPTPTPTAQMAQRIAAAQRQRNIQRRRHHQTQTGGCTQKGLHTFMRASMIVAIWHLFVLFCLHFTYVGPRIAKHIAFEDVGVTRSLLDKGQKIVKSTCLENALKTRPVEERSQFFTMFGEAVKEDGEEEDDDDDKTKTNDLANSTSRGQNQNNTTETTSPPLLGRDEILQIKIIYENDDCPGGCSRVRNVNMTTPSSNATIPTSATENEEAARTLWTSGLRRSMGLDSLTIKEEEEVLVDRYSTLDYWNENVYKFSTNEALMYLDDKLLHYHNVSIVNVTLTERCLSTGSDDGEFSLMSKFAKHMAQIYGMDSVIINQFMYSIKTTDGKFRNGHLQKMETKERWMYSKYQLEESYEVRHNVIFWFFNRVGVLALSLAAFFLVTSVTALIVRELTSSGVMVMFPMFALLRAWGVPGANDRVLEVSYPWVGRARRAVVRARIHPFEHYIWANLAKLALMYTLYESSQVAWSAMLYSKSTPANLPLWIFGNSMIYEYFNMIFVRSALSAYFYPRMTLLYFLGYHIYFYSVPYGFFDVGLIPWVLLMIHTMIYTVIALEIPASSRGAVSIESPREVFAKLSWPEWSANIPAQWTLFLPLNSRYIPIHDRNVNVNANANANANQDQGGMATMGEQVDGTARGGGEEDDTDATRDNLS